MTSSRTGIGTLTAVPDHRGEALERRVQGEDGTLGPQLLGEAERGVENDDQADRRRLDRLADRCRDQRRRDEQADEGLDQLAGGDAAVGRAASAPELVRPVPLEPGRGLCGIEAAHRIGAELERDPLGIQGVRRLQPRFGHRMIIALRSATRSAVHDRLSGLLTPVPCPAFTLDEP